MSYQPVVPLSGIAGWRFLQKTQAKQEAAFDKSADIQRDVAYFEEKIGSITSAADLVADRRLLKVALGAFGLESEIDKKALIRKVLDEGTQSSSSLASRLTDPAWKKLSAAFGFGDTAGAQTAVSGFATKIAAAYKTHAFEVAVGENNDNMRLALNFKREAATLAANGSSWYSILGSKSLRAVMDKALGLPDSFSQIDLDKQAEIYADKASKLLGGDTVAEAFGDSANIEKTITRFLARAQIEAGTSDTTSSAALALTLLTGRSSGSGSSGLMNLLASR